MITDSRFSPRSLQHAYTHTPTVTHTHTHTHLYSRTHCTQWLENEFMGYLREWQEELKLKFPSKKERNKMLESRDTGRTANDRYYATRTADNELYDA